MQQLHKLISPFAINSAGSKAVTGGLLLLMLAVGYLDSWIALFSLWTDQEQTAYSFGFLVLLCTCYLVYQKRSQLADLSIRHVPWLLLPVLMLSGLWLVASFVELQTVQLAVLPLIVLAITTAFFGVEYSRLTALPVLLLLFAIPLWWPLLPLLKDITVLVTEGFLRVIGKPLFVEGYYLHLPGGTFLVDDGCAGLRFLLITLTLAFVGIDLNALTFRAASMLLGAGVLLALVANWIRVGIVVLVGDYTRMQHALVYDHNNLGWVVYGIIVLIPFLFILHRVSRSTLNQAPRLAGAQSRQEANSHYYLMLMLSGAVLISGPLAFAAFSAQDFPERRADLPGTPSGWTRSQDSAPSPADWRPAYVGASEVQYASYRSDGVELALHIVNYAVQQEGKELISILNDIADGEAWREIADGGTEVTFMDADGNSLLVTESSVRSRNGRRRLVWHWFEVGRFSTNNAVYAKFYQMLSVLDRRQDGNLFALTVECSGRCDDDRHLAGQFFSQIYPEIKSAIVGID